MKAGQFILFALVVACASGRDASLDHRWEGFKLKHGKTSYERSEEVWRRDVWEANIRLIDEHNELFRKRVHTYTVEENAFADMTDEEFMELNTGLVIDAKLKYPNTDVPTHDNETTDGLPTEIDYRKEGMVSEVKNQGRCGSCYAFSATGSIEGQHFKATGELISLSEQNILDCSGPEGNHGCRGGLMDQAFQYVIRAGGLDTEQSYPYEGRVRKCRFNNSTIGARISSYVDVKSGSEAALQNALASVGPISVAIDASRFGLKFYKWGVYSDGWCSKTHLNHGVLAVGYGVQSSFFSGSTPYWIVKNSWGKFWGKSGYVLIRRGLNTCGIATAPSYPVV